RLLDETPLTLTGSLGEDLARLEQRHPVRAIEQRLAKLETWATGLPLVALSLLMPLTLHLVVAIVCGLAKCEEYGNWIQVSLIVVGHAHLALVAMTIGFARKLRRMANHEIAVMSVHREWAKAWAAAIAAACMPGVVFLLVPPLLTMVTGLLFIPLMFFMT